MVRGVVQGSVASRRHWGADARQPFRIRREGREVLARQTPRIFMAEIPLSLGNGTLKRCSFYTLAHEYSWCLASQDLPSFPPKPKRRPCVGSPVAPTVHGSLNHPPNHTLYKLLYITPLFFFFFPSVGPTAIPQLTRTSLSPIP